MITLDGTPLPLSDLVAVADGAPVELSRAGRERAGAAHDLAVRISAERTVYGRTTGVGANKDTAVVATATVEHGQRLLLSHATSAGARRDARRVRLTMAIRLNQLAVGGSGASGPVLEALAELLATGTTPPVREHGSVGTGDLGPLATIGLALPGVTWTADDALPFLSSNAATLADAALAVHDLQTLTTAGLAIAAVTFAAAGGQPEAFAEAVAEVTPQPGARRVGAVLRALVGPGSGAPPPRRLQDPFALRCLPQVHGPALDALAAAAGLVEVAAGTATENPRVDLGRQDLLHHGGFHAAYLAGALDSARLAVAGAAGLSLRRLALLLDPELTGLAPFLGDGTPGASGAMGLEYAAASALGDLRASAHPASLQTVSLSRGVEDDASYASLAARQSLAAGAPYAVVLAAEAVAAVRAVRLAGLTGSRTGWGAVVQACAGLPGAGPGELADRDLTPDLDAAVELLPSLAALV